MNWLTDKRAKKSSAEDDKKQQIIGRIWQG
jgi:hypothetical protein